MGDEVYFSVVHFFSTESLCIIKLKDEVGSPLGEFEWFPYYTSSVTNGKFNTVLGTTKIVNNDGCGEISINTGGETKHLSISGHFTLITENNFVEEEEEE